MLSELVRRSELWSSVDRKPILKRLTACLGSERHLEILPPSYRDKGLVPPKKLAALAELLGSFGEDEEILYLASGDPLITAWARDVREVQGARGHLAGISAMQYLASRIALPMNDAYLTSSHVMLRCLTLT